MAIKARDFIAKLPEHEQRAIAAEAERLIFEDQTLSAIRDARRFSQDELADKLGIRQPAVSKIERKADLYVSTLRKYIEGVGGELEILVRFPDREPVRITQFSPLKRGTGRQRRKDSKRLE
jgi:transcriptional regulator with XRE-family HTH domain